MKDSKEYSKKVASFFKKYRGNTVLKQFESEDQVDSLVYSVLYEYLKTDEISTFVALLRSHFVDWNDLRVSRLEEILDVLVPLELSTDKKKKVAQQLVGCLNSVFTKYDRISFEDIEELGKRQAYQELEALDFFTPFVVNFLMLNFKGSHSLPLNTMMIDYVKEHDLVHPESTDQEISSFLERQIQVDDIYDFYLILRQMAESPELAKAESTPATKSSAKSAKKSTATTKSKPTKKATATKAKNKTAAKKPAAKKKSSKK